MSRSVIVIVGAFAVLFGGIVWAGEESGDALGNRDRMRLEMLASRLKLTDAQKAELKKIMVESKKESDSKIQALLNEEQKSEYKKMSEEGGGRDWRGGMGRRGERGGPGGPGMRGPGGMGGFQFGGPGGFERGFGQTLEDMKKRLNLTEGQYERVQEIMGEIGEEAMGKFMEKLPDYMENGRPNFRKMMEEMSGEMDKLIDASAERIKKVLKEDQIPEFEKMIGEFKEQFKQMRAGGRRGEGVPGAGGEAPPWRRNRLDRIMEDLKGSPEELAVLRDEIKKILDAEEQWDEKIRNAGRELRTLFNEGEPSTESVREKLNAMRELGRQREAALKALREELVLILSPAQEAKLVLHRVLE